MPEPEIVRHASSQELAEAVATRLVTRLAEAQAAGREPQVGLTGGTIADAIHEAAVTASKRVDLDWSRVVFWWGDERYVPGGDDERNARQARAALLDHVDVDPAKVHEIPASDAGYADVEAAADAYAEQLRTSGAGEFDVLMLGVGPDGHVASLFPGFPQLDARDRIVVGVTGSPKPPPERVTLTYEALNRSREVWFVVSGEAKADAVARALADGTNRHDVPAAGVVGRLGTTWFLDAGSASRLR
ncbi:MAG: 6-phosphogluconolactonase [Nocardioidaceae bacterium]|nr:6-phosphogluconolactonase [Nocardioidaceae bacterium]